MRIACNLWSKIGCFPYLKTHEKDKTDLHPYFTQFGGDREDNPDQYIAGMADGAAAGFKYFSLESPKTVTVTLWGNGNGYMEIRLRPDGNPVVRLRVCPDGNWGDFTANINCTVAGTHALYFTYTGEGSIDFKAFSLY